MISSNDLKPGLTIQQDNNIFVVLESSQNKQARSGMIVKAKVKNLRTGAIVELSFAGGDKIENAHIDKKEMQYLYCLLYTSSHWIPFSPKFCKVRNLTSIVNTIKTHLWC